MKKKFLFALLMLSTVTAFSAEPVPTETAPAAKIIPDTTPASKWSSEIELGYLETSGNTDTQSLQTKGKIVNERVNWKHKATIEIIKKEENEITTAKRTYITAKSDYNINPLSYLFLALSYEKDDFSGYDKQYSEAVGYGYHVIKQEDMTLDLEIGAGARQSYLTTNGTTNETIAKGALDFKWKFSKSSTFTQLIGIESSQENTITRSSSAIKIQINGNLSTRLSHSIKNSTSVPVGKKKTDAESMITLVYSFH